MKTTVRLLALLCLSALCLTALAGCTTPASDGKETTENTVVTTEAVTETPVRVLTVDDSYRIVISAEADEVTQKAADMVAATFLEKAGVELAVVTDAETPSEHEIILGTTNRAESSAEEGWSVSLNGDSICIDAFDPITLYYAAEAVLTTWLTADFGLAEAGTVTLPEPRVADLNGLTTKRDNSFTIMTQNMRGSDDPNGNSVPERFERFKLLLADYQPDVIGTQEHTSNWSIRLERLFKNLPEDDATPQYGLVGPGLGGECHILYRMDRFELVDSGTFWLSDTPEVPSVAEGVSSNFKRVCTWALLKDKRTEQTILVANTHLDHTSGILRERQITILMNYMAEQIGEYPFFLTGDFNSSQGSETYNIVADTLLDTHKTAWIDLSTEKRTYHGYREFGGSMIDFIFHDDESTALTYEIMSKDYDGFVSDHYGVIAEFIVE